MTTDHSKLLQIAHEAVDHAKPLFLNGTTNELTAKGDRDYATETDYQIERELRHLLAKATPDIGFLGEEDGHTGTDQRYWCLDPIDGTVNYVHGNPLCGISLALVEGDTPTVGIVDLPRIGDRYWGYEGGGAYQDGRPIRASKVEAINEAVVTFGDFAVGDDAIQKNEARMGIFVRLVEEVLRIRMLGAAALDLAWVADGRTDAALIVGGSEWDLAGGAVVVREAQATYVRASLCGCAISMAGNTKLIDAIAGRLDLEF